MQIGRLGSLIGFSIGCVGTGIQMIAPDPKFWGWLLITVGFDTMVVSLAWWFFANYRPRVPWVKRAAGANPVAAELSNKLYPPIESNHRRLFPPRSMLPTFDFLLID